MSKFDKKLRKHEKLREKLHDLLEELDSSENELQISAITEYSNEYFDRLLSICELRGQPEYIVSEIHLHRTQWSNGKLKIEDMVRIKLLERTITPKKDFIGRLHYSISKEDYK